MAPPGLHGGPRETASTPRGELVVVDDPRDARLDDYRSLADPAERTRREEEGGIFVVEGRLAVARVAASSYEVASLLVDDHQVDLARDVVDAVRAKGAPVYAAPRDVVAATVGFPFHRGVVAVARRPAATDWKTLVAPALTGDGGDRRSVVVAVEGVNDHENLGALFRNAAAFQVAAVLLDPTCADPLYRRAVRVSLGHVTSVPFARVAPWPAALAGVRSAGLEVVALAPEHAALPPEAPRPVHVRRYAAARRTGPVAVVVGAEGPGLSPGTLAAVDEVVSIPMAGGVDSLNVATAAAIALYELAT